MSLGANLLLGLVGQAARSLGDAYDVEVVEAHHRFKKDAPSGTALALARAAGEALGRKLERVGVAGRSGSSERRKTDIGMLSVRAGDIAGEHTVLFGGIGERVELTHRAHGREAFGRGAIRAARWVAGRENGLHTMQDVLGLPSPRLTWGAFYTNQGIYFQWLRNLQNRTMSLRKKRWSGSPSGSAG